jgi:hypothetical protein
MSNPAADRRRRDEEDTAVVVALLAGLSGPTEPPPAPRTVWGQPDFTAGRVLSPHPNAWWASGLPRR